MSRAARCLLIALALALTGIAHAQSAQPWSSLSAQQRSLLAPLERDWTTISPGQQQKWIQLSDRPMSADERVRIQQRMTDWARLPPQERARARLNFQEARPLGREERKQQWEAYRALPPEQRREFAERARPGSGAKTEARAETKANGVRAPAQQPVGATVVQRGTGATTNLVSKPPAPPLHQQAGLPRVSATPNFVDSATLLPKRGAQAAAVRSSGGGDDKRDNKPQDSRK